MAKNNSPLTHCHNNLIAEIVEYASHYNSQLSNINLFLPIHFDINIDISLKKKCRLVLNFQSYIIEYSFNR